MEAVFLRFGSTGTREFPPRTAQGNQGQPVRGAVVSSGATFASRSSRGRAFCCGSCLPRIQQGALQACFEKEFSFAEFEAKTEGLASLVLLCEASTGGAAFSREPSSAAETRAFAPWTSGARLCFWWTARALRCAAPRRAAASSWQVPRTRHSEWGAGECA